MPYKIAGIDVHKRMLAVVVSDVEIESEYQFDRRMFGSNPEQLRSLAAWLVEQEEIVYRRSVLRLGHNQAIGAIAHRQCQLIWLILHQGVRYEERGPAVTKQSKQRRTAKMIRQLRSLGYRIEPQNQPSQAQAV
jgi:hypothetical protein